MLRKKNPSDTTGDRSRDLPASTQAHCLSYVHRNSLNIYRGGINLQWKLQAYMLLAGIFSAKYGCQNSKATYAVCIDLKLLSIMNISNVFLLVLTILPNEKHKEGLIVFSLREKRHFSFNSCIGYYNKTSKYVPGTRHIYILLLGHAVAQLVEALRYKSEGCGFVSQWCHWNFPLT